MIQWQSSLCNEYKKRDKLDCCNEYIPLENSTQLYASVATSILKKELLHESATSWNVSQAAIATLCA